MVSVDQTVFYCLSPVSSHALECFTQSFICYPIICVYVCISIRVHVCMQGRDRIQVYRVHVEIKGQLLSTCAVCPEMELKSLIFPLAFFPWVGREERAKLWLSQMLHGGERRALTPDNPTLHWQVEDHHNYTSASLASALDVPGYVSKGCSPNHAP